MAVAELTENRSRRVSSEELWEAIEDRIGGREEESLGQLCPTSFHSSFWWSEQ